MDDTQTVARKLTMNNTRLLEEVMKLISIDKVDKTVSVLSSASKVYVFGVGSSEITALDAHYKFMRLGLNAEVHRDSHIIAMSAALAKKDDVVFCISSSGSTKDLVDAVKDCKVGRSHRDLFDVPCEIADYQLRGYRFACPIQGVALPGRRLVNQNSSNP